MKTYFRHYKEEEIDQTGIDNRTLRRLFSYFSPYKGWISLAIFLLLLAKGIEAAVPIVLGWFVDEALSISEETLRPFLLHNSYLLLFLVAGYGFETWTAYIKSFVGQKALLTLRNEVYLHIESLPIDFFSKNAVGRLISRSIHDVDKISQMFTESAVPMISNLILFIGIGCGIFIVDATLGSVLLLIVPIAWWILHTFRLSIQKIYAKIRAVLSAMNVFVQEYITGAHIIRYFGLRKREKRHFDEINHDYRLANSRTSHYYSMFFASLDSLQSFSLILVFFVLILMTPTTLSFPTSTFFTYSLYIFLFFRPLWDLAERYNILLSAQAAAERVFATLQEKPEAPDAPHAIPLESMESIVFDNVWFAYESEQWILKGLNLSLNKGESTALVGMTGAGKSTVLKLLLRFYDHQKGNIFINGKNIHDYTRASIRAQCSVVSQDPWIFTDTLAANISLHHPNISQGKIEQVVDYVGLGSIVAKWPKRLETPLLAQGNALSLGEKQLVTLARALAHDRSLLLLDEATANIDTKTEHLIQETLQKILPHKTALVIAHRLSTIKDVDRIAVLQEGIVAEEGSHQQLLDKKGIYEKLYRYQFLNH